MSKKDKDEEKQKEEDSLRRAHVKLGKKALASLRDSFESLGATEKPAIAGALALLESELEELRPPDPRKCKEYLRAVSRKKKGLMGIRPEDVVLYCQCPECGGLREKLGLRQPGDEGDNILAPTVSETVDGMPQEPDMPGETVSQ